MTSILLIIALVTSALQWAPQIILTIRSPRNTDTLSFPMLTLGLVAGLSWSVIDLLYHLPIVIPTLGILSSLPILVLMGIKLGYRYADYDAAAK